MKNNQMDDEAAQKKRGIASADKIGFFERIRMGNIDDPSQSYKLGAGVASNSKQKIYRNR
jgi:hypothetical protein